MLTPKELFGPKNKECVWIEVTKKDIEDGEKSVEGCPITLALQRAFGKDISISRDYIRVLKRSKGKYASKYKLIKLPKQASNFLIDYDNKSSKPFKFWISNTDVKKITGGK